MKITEVSNELSSAKQFAALVIAPYASDFPQAAQYLAVLSEAYARYEAALNALNAAESQVTAYENAVKDSAGQLAQSDHALPDVAKIVEWSSERHRLRNLQNDAAYAANTAVATLLPPAQYTLDQAKRVLTEKLSGAVMIEIMILQDKQSRQTLTPDESQRLYLLQVSAIASASGHD